MSTSFFSKPIVIDGGTGEYRPIVMGGGGSGGINKKWWPKVKGEEFDDWDLIPGGTPDIGGDFGLINTAKETI